MTEEKDYLDLWFKWVRREWFTIVAIILILLTVAWHQTQIGDAVEKNVDNCEAYYNNLIEENCPALSKYFEEEPIYNIEVPK